MKCLNEPEEKKKLSTAAARLPETRSGPNPLTEENYALLKFLCKGSLLSGARKASRTLRTTRRRRDVPQFVCTVPRQLSEDREPG